MSIENFCKRMRDENIGPKDRFIHLNIGHGCITRYIGPLTLAHAEYIVNLLHKKEEAKFLLNDKYAKTYATIIQLERPRYACDPITEDKTNPVYDAVFKLV